MLSDAEMNRQQGCCMPSLMEMEMSFAFYTFVLFFSVVASYIRCVINTQMISQTSLISNENIQYDKTTIVVVVFFLLYYLSVYRYDLFYRQQYGGKIEATTNQMDANCRSI